MPGVSSVVDEQSPHSVALGHLHQTSAALDRPCQDLLVHVLSTHGHLLSTHGHLLSTHGHLLSTHGHILSTYTNYHHTETYCHHTYTNSILKCTVFIIIINLGKISNNDTNKTTSLALISSKNPSSVVQQNQRIRHSRDHVQCKTSSTDGWRCQEVKEDRPFCKDRFSDYGEMKLYFLLILRCRGVNSTGLVRQPRKLEFQRLS